MSTAHREAQRRQNLAQGALPAAILTVGFLLAACGADRPADADGSALAAESNSEAMQQGHESHDGGHPASMDGQPLGMMTSHTPGGVPVHLTLDPDRPIAGPVSLRIVVDDEAVDPSEITVDLVAPRMPAHGILRFPTRTTDGKEMESDIRIPMEGLWMVYVNLDHGSEAAPFEFEVLPGEGGHGHEHHVNSNESREMHEHP